MRKLIYLLPILLSLSFSMETFTQEQDPFRVASLITLLKGTIEEDDEMVLRIVFRQEGLTISRTYVRKFKTLSDELCIMIFDIKSRVMVVSISGERGQIYMLNKFTPNGDVIGNYYGNKVDVEIARFMAAAILQKYLSSSDLQGI